jgi:hypothetical protein
MKILMILILGTLLTGCDPYVDKYGITGEVTVSGFNSKEGAVISVRSKALVICKRNGYTSIRELSIVTVGNSSPKFGAIFIGECYGKVKGKDENN